MAVANAGLLPAPITKTLVTPLEEHSPPQYDFSYSVHDPHTGDIKHQQETRLGDSVQGQYSLIEPDGTRRIVHYTADDHNGFNAVVQRENIAHQIPVKQPTIIAAKQIVPVQQSLVQTPITIAQRSPVSIVPQLALGHQQLSLARQSPIAVHQQISYAQQIPIGVTPQLALGQQQIALPHQSSISIGPQLTLGQQQISLAPQLALSRQQIVPHQSTIGIVPQLGLAQQSISPLVLSHQGLRGVALNGLSIGELGLSQQIITQQNLNNLGLGIQQLSH